ncbi:N-6 DNA methylase [Amycolatopsis sp. NPDC024027]|uniref:class I SAM-dependent DNA methyltransferase n=1 Tax=Amycolatopsis sp. NPDC024027 TaxID=3154327 RepID=UPI0034094780
MSNFRNLTSLVWSVADLMRGRLTSSEHAKILIPFTVLRRLESVRAGENVTLAELATRPDITVQAFSDYIGSFPPIVRVPLEEYDFLRIMQQLDDNAVLHQVVARFAEIDLSAETVSNSDIVHVFDDLCRGAADRFIEQTGEFSTPPDVATLAVKLLVGPDSAALATTSSPRTALDPVCGSGGFLNELSKQLAAINPALDLGLYGQEINHETWAICRMRMLLEDRDSSRIELGDTLSDDRHPDQQFDYLIATAPFGVEWKKSAEFVRQEHENLGMAGRFGAGIPGMADGSLLFLQHLLSKMNPAGSRVVTLFNEPVMQRGRAGSGESEIRRWVIENDWLECVVALPDSMLHNTSIPTYLWTLTNRKSDDRRGKVVLVDARDQAERMRKPQGSKGKYLTHEQVDVIAQTCLHPVQARSDPDHPMSDRVRVVENRDLGHQRIIIERPLRLRFELTDGALTELSASCLARDGDNLEGVVAALQGKLGSAWPDEESALAGVKRMVRDAGYLWPPDPGFRRAVVRTMGIRHADGTVQMRRGAPLPDPEQRRSVRVPLDTDFDAYLRTEVLPGAPDAWVDRESAEIGYAISPMLFFRYTLDAEFVNLHQLAEPVADRVKPSNTGHQLRQLRGKDLHSVDSAAKLPATAGADSRLVICTGGDLVGNGASWRALPADFGEAATSLPALRPHGPYGRALCEWINHRTDHTRFSHAPRHPPDDLPVPIDLITDDLLDGVLEELQRHRRTLGGAVSNLVPNVFSATNRDVRHFREHARSIAVQAGLADDVMTSAIDPVWQAELTFPFHVAALARQYRLSVQPAERKDALLKLGEGLARTIGILVLTESSDGGRLPATLDRSFRTGATFGTWLTIINRFMRGSAPPKMRELAELKLGTRLVELLRAIKDARNDSSHAHGVRATHQLEDEADALEPVVLSALTSANWLSTVHWDWVARCEYQDEFSYLLVGQRLRGSHPSWEPFERSSTYPLRPGRIYTGTDTTTETGRPVDLSPLAEARICADCQTRELFLINTVMGDDITLRSLADHAADVTQSPAPAEGE